MGSFPQCFPHLHRQWGENGFQPGSFFINLTKRRGISVISGKYDFSLDAKNRIFVPAKLREDLGEQIVMVKGIDRCISVSSPFRVGELLRQVRGAA